jgi:hypothetical protein
MSDVLRSEDGTYAHELGHCDPIIDLDTHWLLLALMSKMVKHRDKTGDPEAAALVYQLGAIIQRHEP